MIRHSIGGGSGQGHSTKLSSGDGRVDRWDSRKISWNLWFIWQRETLFKFQFIHHFITFLVPASLSLSLGSWGDHRKVREVPSLRTMNVNLNLLSVSTKSSDCVLWQSVISCSSNNIYALCQMIKIPIDLNRAKLYFDTCRSRWSLTRSDSTSNCWLYLVEAWCHRPSNKFMMCHIRSNRQWI